MANIGSTSASTAPVSSSSLSPPPTTYAPNVSSAERALATPQAQMASEVPAPSELKQRPRQPGQPNSGSDSSTGSDETLIPSTSDGQGTVQGSQIRCSALAILCRHLGRLLLAPFSGSSGHTSVKSDETSQDVRYKDIQYKKVEDYSEGIPRLGKLLDSNESFCIFRGFRPETARLLLVRELELDKLAREIHNLDNDDAANHDTKNRLKTIELLESCDETRNDLLDKWERKVMAYYDILLKYKEIRSLQRPKSRHYHSVYNWIWDRGPLFREEYSFILPADDFVTAKASQSSPTHRSRIEDMIESCLTNHPESSIINLFRGKAEARKSEDPLVVNLSTGRMTKWAKAIAAFLAVGTLLIPILVMFLVQPSREVMASIVAVFVTVLMGTALVVVDMTTYEVFIVMAAYTAVLTALLANMTN